MNNTSVPPQGEPYLYDGAGAPPVSMGVWVKAAWRRKWLMLPLLALVVGGGVLFTYLEKPVYEATALLAFGQRSSGAFNVQGGEQVTGNFVSEQISLMTRDATLGEIARDPDLALPKTPMFRGETDLVEALKDHIKISLLKDTTVLSVSVQGPDSKLVTAIANKVADYQRASVESSRDVDMRSAVSEYVKKMAHMSSEMNEISQNIWARANSAGIAGLIFNAQQKDGRVIVAAFQRQSAALLAQRGEARKQLDQSSADLATAEAQFDAECASLLQAAPIEVKPGAGNETSPTPATTEKASATASATPAAPAQPASAAAVVAATATPAVAATPVPPKDKLSTDTAGKPEPPAKTIPMVTAAQLATLYQQLLKVEEEEAESEPASGPAKGAGNPRPAAMEKSRGEIMARIEGLSWLYQLQYQRAQETAQERTADQENIAKQTERIREIEEELDVRKQSLTPETYGQDFVVKSLLERKAALETQSEADRAKLNAGFSNLDPRILEEGQKIQQLTKAVSMVRSLRLGRKIYRENYETTQAALDALTGPLNDILIESERYERVDQAYLKTEEWVRDVKLALSQISVNVYDATEPTIPIRPKWPINIALSGMLGIMASFGVAMLLEFGRKTVKTPADATRSLGAPVLGVVPHFRRLDFGDNVFSLDALKDSGVTETFNEVRFYLHAAVEGQQPRSILVTSAASREGKTTVSMLLAHSLARSGEKVLLVDANLRLPYLHLVFQCDSQPGLADILHNGADIRSCIRTTGIQNLSIMTAGAAGEDGLAWVQPEQFAQFVRAAGESFDHVIFDSTSTIGVADVRIMASGVDAVIYVVQAARLNGALVSRGIENIRHAHANLIGVVLNNARYTKGDHYYFHKRAGSRVGEPKRATDDEPADADKEGNGKE